MANENNYCACNDGDAHYIIELNQQGAPGQQGEAGAEGFSPEIVYTITDTEFVVKVVNKDGITETPNLFNDYIAKKDLSNTNIANEYLKIDGSNASGSMTLNVPVTTGDLTVSGYLTTPANRDATIYRMNTRSIQVDSGVGFMTLGSRAQIWSDGTIKYKHLGSDIYEEIVNRTDIPTVYNSTITLTQGGVTKGSFTLNQSTSGTIDLDAGGSLTEADKLSSTVYNTDTQRLIATGFAITNNGTSATFSTSFSTELQQYNPVTEQWVTIIKNTSYPFITGISGTNPITATTTNGATALSLAYDSDTLGLNDNNELTVVGGGTTYTAGTGIDITSDIISVEDTQEFDTVTLANTINNNGEGLYGTIADGSSTLPLVRIDSLDNALFGNTTSEIYLFGDNTRPYYNNSINTLALTSDIPTSNEIEAHKAYKSTGELLTDSKGLADVKEYAHSTFDLSKFTLQGTPTITDDGIASGLNNSNFVKLPIFSTSGNDFVFIGSYTTPSTLPATGFMIIGGNNSAGRGAFQFYYNVSGHLNASCFVDNSGTQVKLTRSLDVTWAVNTTYDFCCIKQGTSYNFGIKKSTDSTYTMAEALTSSYPLMDSSAQQIGNAANFGGSVDLKQFYLIVNGATVVSGNKTGMDTIKPDDYTVVNNGRVLYAYVYNDGTNDHTTYADSSSAPTALYNADGTRYKGTDFTVSSNVVYYGENACTYTSSSNVTVYLSITDDGVASGLSSSNYIKYTTADILNGKSWKIIQKVYWDGNTASFLMFADASALLRITGYKELFFQASTTNNTQIYLVKYSPSLFSGAGYYYIGVAFEYATGTYTIYGGTTLENITSLDSVSKGSGEQLKNLNNSSYIYSGGYTNRSSIDLNTVKIYIDGSLVYQPCLKIPYTLSRTGSKIVDSVYRDRVNDCAEQFGQANYYTLDETNNNFTLPQIELYGLIGQRTLKDTYRNGIFYYDLYSDRTLEQGGSCTSGTDVTFLKPFSDTNYVLTVPYSAKTTTGFTPSATGDWIAKGIGEL